MDIHKEFCNASLLRRDQTRRMCHLDSRRTWKLDDFAQLIFQYVREL